MKDWRENRFCEVCKKEYTPKSMNQKFCSCECRDYKVYINKKNHEQLTFDEFVKLNSAKCGKCGEIIYKKRLYTNLVYVYGFDGLCDDCYKIVVDEKFKEDKERRIIIKEKMEQERLKQEKICPECGKSFSHQYFKHCSMECWLSEQHRSVTHTYSCESLFKIVDLIKECELQGDKISKVLISGDKIILKNINGGDRIISVIGDSSSEE